MGQRAALTDRETELLRRTQPRPQQSGDRPSDVHYGGDDQGAFVFGIFRKLDVHNRTAAVAKARQLGLL